MIYSIIKESPEEEGKVQCRQLARTVVHHSVAQMLPAAYCSNLSGANLSCMLCSWSELSLPIGVDEFSFWKVRLVERSSQGGRRTLTHFLGEGEIFTPALL